MANPTPHYYNITAAGNGLIAQMNGLGPTGVLTDSLEDFGDVLVDCWKVKCLVLGFADPDDQGVRSLKFWLNDDTALLGGSTPVTLLDAGEPWEFRYLLANAYSDPAAFTAGQIAAWTSLPVSSPGIDIDAGIVSITGNDGTTNPVVAAGSIANTLLANAFLYLAVKPNVNADNGEYLDWGFRGTFVTPA